MGDLGIMRDPIDTRSSRSMITPALWRKLGSIARDAVVASVD